MNTKKIWKLWQKTGNISWLQDLFRVTCLFYIIPCVSAENCIFLSTTKYHVYKNKVEVERILCCLLLANQSAPPKGYSVLLFKSFYFFTLSPLAEYERYTLKLIYKMSRTCLLWNYIFSLQSEKIKIHLKQDFYWHIIKWLK